MRRQAQNSVPRASGGDPVSHASDVVSGILFPAQAGVIPLTDKQKSQARTVPRASGGDPAKADTCAAIIGCSPRKRG